MVEMRSGGGGPTKMKTLVRAFAVSKCAGNYTEFQSAVPRQAGIATFRIAASCWGHPFLEFALGTWHVFVCGAAVKMYDAEGTETPAVSTA